MAKSSENKSDKQEAIKYDIHSCDGKVVGSFELDARLFGVKPNRTLVFDTVRWQLNKRRAGTHSTLTRSAMKGGGKKPWRQKGTGRARAGSNISPIWVGGAIAHGPKPRDYSSRLPKRTRRSALISVLSQKAQLKQIILLDKFNAESSGKSKDADKSLSVLRELKIKEQGDKQNAKSLKRGNKMIFLVDGKTSAPETKSWKSVRNLTYVHPLSLDGLNVYDMLRHPYLVMTKECVEALQTKYLAKE